MTPPPTLYVLPLNVTEVIVGHQGGIIIAWTK